LFVELDLTGDVHFAEMAHIIAASPNGPRGDGDEEPIELGAWSNLVLLCASCHTLVDRAPSDFPLDVLRGWKVDRLREIELGVGVSSFDTRARARAAVQPFLSANRAFHESFGPDHEGHADPASEFPRAWHDAVVNGIIPNSRRIQRIADANLDLLTEQEIQLVGQFVIHVDGLEARHVGGQLDAIVVRFPEGMEDLFAD
jgi:hypothetical protein